MVEGARLELFSGGPVKGGRLILNVIEQAYLNRSFSNRQSATGA